MNGKKDIAYWIALAHLPRWGAEKINRLIVKIIHERNETPEDFFSRPEKEWKSVYDLPDKEIADLKQAKGDLPKNSFLAEDLISQGYEVIPINSPHYSPVLKKNLKIRYSPPVLYVKGEKQIMQERSIAIVGSRDAAENSLHFTDLIAKKATQEYKVIVSGFAKGVDKQALDSALKYKGRSIIVLPQGIMTFTGYKNYYRQIIEGDVLVLSVFPPKVEWSVGLAMARNAFIYGLAEDIYVAQSSDKGGTWEGAVDGLKKGRKIFVRVPEAGEVNANLKLIELGAISIDANGSIMEEYINKVGEPPISFKVKQVGSEPVGADKSINLNDVLELLKEHSSLSSTEIKEKLNLGLSVRTLTATLKKYDEIETTNDKPVQFKLKGRNRQLNIF